MQIPASEYAQRRQQLMAKIGKGTAIFRSAPTAVMHNDVEYLYRQDSDFFYLTGFNEAEAVAVLAPHHAEHQFILFVQPKNPELETWTGYRLGVEAAKEALGADLVYSIADIEKELPQYLATAERIYYHLGRDHTFNQLILSIWQKLLATIPRRGTGPVGIEDPSLILHPLRQIKSDAEIEMMRIATGISAIAHNRAREFTQVGQYEYQVQAEIEHTFRLNGAFGPAYPSIVASGDNACILHYTENNRQIQAGDLLLIDAGCSFGYYNGDITRTFAVDGKFTAEQQAIYDLVLEAQLKAIEQVKAGNTYNQFHDTAVAVIVEGLLELGLLVGDKEEIITQEKYKPFYMHRTGHWLGLDVHDVGLYKTNPENWQVLQPGHILTVEPGIYIAPNFQPAEGQPDVPSHWRGIGVRIEDDVLVTPTGNEVLTAAVAK
ncbi:MAG: M24 family metallopeptidase [Gloeocapsa sp. DLM2.Bin57]|nr:MAG: M24 family metallopeptidase [Gloeocapsa sp. DLM2.Bin57]